MLTNGGEMEREPGANKAALADHLRTNLSDDECAIGGKTLKQHNISSGYGVCQIYPIFVSKRQMVERLLAQPTLQP